MIGGATNGRRIAMTAVVMALGLALASCMFSPGKFVSALDIRKSGTFRFSYSGEIHVLALSKLTAAMQGGSGDGTFTPQPCYAEGSSAERKCSAAELAEQKRVWQETQSAGAARRGREAESMKAMFGGIDPADPRAAEDLAVRLRRQAGWRKVVHRGDGLFDVEFAIEGRLDHDFSFPTIERFPAANPFIQVMLRADRTVRIDAPAFAPAAAGEPYRGWMQAAALGDGRQRAPQLPEMDGMFTVTSDAAVLANNTDTGPQAEPAGQRLDWRVNARSAAAPMALLRLEH